MKKVLIIGFGVSGKSAAEFCLSRGMKVAAVDKNCIEYPNIEIFHEEEEFALDFDFAVCSPGISNGHPLLKKLQAAAIPVTGEAKLALSFIKQPVLGVTGTNGKTTVTLLAEHFLNFSGKKARALGNVGVALTSAVDTLLPDEIVIAELSSYQLEGLNGPLLDASVLLNITPDHLDRYKSMKEYADAKLKIKAITKNPFSCFVDEKVFHRYETFPSSCYGYEKGDLTTDFSRIFYKGKFQCELPETLKGSKSIDLENFMAAFALILHLDIDPARIVEAYSVFTRPHHRIEFVREIQKVKFFDDSKGTNVDAVIRAVEKMDGPVHLIAGGVDKGSSYLPWVEPFIGKVKKLYLIGESAPIISRELQAYFSIDLYPCLELAVGAAYHNAKEGENILLSPGCSSFDMFKDYIDRGRAFQTAVHRLYNPSHFDKLAKL